VTEPALPQRLLADHLAAGAPKRELFVAQMFVGLTVFALTMVLVLAPADRRGEIVSHLPYFAPGLVYHLALIGVLRRGWFHPAVPWINAAVQTSIILPAFVLTIREQGVAEAVQGSMQVGWMAVVAAAALKASPVISIASGLLAAAEYVGVTLYHDDGVLTSHQRAELFTDAAFLVLSGVAAAGIALYLVRQAQQALRAVREQDLMGKYFMHERLGSGGMAEVFRATYSPEGGFEKIVAIKRVLPEVAAAANGRLFLDMFREEARLCASLSHPNVVQVLDAGRFRGSYILAMEYVDGMSLDRVMRRASEPLPLAAIAYVGAELAAALDYIHARVDGEGRPLCLIHRDVNPPNVMISRLGEVKLGDFGVAHAVNRASLDPERVYGKLGYLAPEQIGSAGLAIDGRADLFALGLTLFEMLAGKPLYRGKQLAEVAELRLPEAELDSCPRGSELPRELVRLVTELLAQDPGHRPASGALVRSRLLALGGAAAPYPAGQQELARFARAASERDERPPVPQPTAATAVDRPG
jgi:serine/threonine-protein kinase